MVSLAGLAYFLELIAHVRDRSLYFLDLDKYIMISIHHYSIIQGSFTS